MSIQDQIEAIEAEVEPLAYRLYEVITSMPPTPENKLVAIRALALVVHGVAYSARMPDAVFGIFADAMRNIASPDGEAA